VKATTPVLLTLLHGGQLPLAQLDDLLVEPVDDGVRDDDATLQNNKSMKKIF